MFNIGDAAKRMAELTDLQVLESGLEVLKTIYPKVYSAPRAYIRTNWSKD